MTLDQFKTRHADEISRQIKLKPTLRRYSASFRQEAVMLCQMGIRVTDIAATAHVGEDTVYRWRRKHHLPTGKTQPGIKMVQIDSISPSRPTSNDYILIEFPRGPCLKIPLTR